MEVQMKQLRDQVQKREAEISTLKQHLALLTSDFKYNLKLLEDRDFELDQTEAQLEQIKSTGKRKEREMEVLNSEIANFKATADRDAEQIQSLESTLSQYKESVRSVRQRLEEALQLRDQELSCHRSELEALKTKIHQQSESLKVQEKGLSDAMKACERTWSERYSECHKTVLTLVAEQESLLKEKLAKEREMEIMQNRVLELQNAFDEVTGVTDVSRKECTTLTGQLEALQEHANTRLKVLEQEKQNLERKLRKKILEEYDGKIAELLAQLQSIEYAVSLERREANTRLITLEAQQVEKMTSLHQTVQELRGQRNDLLDKVGKLEKELCSLRENLYQLKNNGRRLSQKEESLTQELTTLQHSLLEAKAELKESQVEKTHELAALHDSLREARSKEKLLLGKEAEQMKRIIVLEQLLENARSEVEHLSKKDSEENREMLMAQEALEKTRKQLHVLSQKNSEQLKEIASSRKSLTEARNEGAMLSKAQAEHTEELAILKRALYDARIMEDIMLRKNEDIAKDLESLRQLLNAAKTREDLMKKELDDQANEIVTLHEALSRAKADGALLMKAEAAHAEEISVLRSTLVETQKQAEAASKHAQHLEAIIEVTQAESRRRVEIKECVSSLLTSQEEQELLRKELTDGPATLSTHIMEDSKDNNNGYNAREVACSNDCKLRASVENGLQTHMGLEEENRYLKARVEELKGENIKVGQVISELRNELETVGLLQPSTGTALHSFAGQQQKIQVVPLEEANIPSQRQAGIVPGSTLKTDPHASFRSRVVDIPGKEDITLSEKEELLTLRALLKDVHNRNALFYKQVASMSDTVPNEKVPERQAEQHGDSFKTARKSDLPTAHIDIHLTSTELVDKPGLFTNEMRNSVTQPTTKPYRSIAADSIGLQESRPKRIQAEAKKLVGVSAEVLKLNEQIARVRQQLTSLCSSEQSISSCQKSSEEIMPRCTSRYKEKPPRANEPFGLRNENEKAAVKGRPSGTTKNKGDLLQKIGFSRRNIEDQEEKVTGNAPPSPKYDHHQKHKHDHYLEEQAGKHTKRGSRKFERPDVMQSTEVILQSKHTVPKKNRTPARDSVSTRSRLKVGRKIRVKIPSDTSSRSDVVCSHCQECMSEEGSQDVLSSSPDISYTESPQPKTVKERNVPKRSHSGHGHASVFTSFGSEEKDDDDSSKSLYQARTSSGTDESESASILQHNCSTHPYNITHVDRRKPPRKTEDTIQQRREETARAKSQPKKDESVLPKQSSPGQKRGLGLASATRRILKSEKSFPAILRERVDPNQSRVSPPRSTKVHY